MNGKNAKVWIGRVGTIGLILATLFVVTSATAVSAGSAASSPRPARSGIVKLQLYCNDDAARRQMRENVGVGMIVGLALGKSSHFKVPDSWLRCDGRTVDAARYPELAALLNQHHDPKVKARRVRLPDYSGMTDWALEGPFWDGVEALGVTLGDATTDSLHLRDDHRAADGNPVSKPRSITWYVKAK